MEINLGLTVITATAMTVTVDASSGIKSWLALWTHQGDDFEDGREFIAKSYNLSIDLSVEVDEGAAPARKSKSGTISWLIGADGLYEFGNVPTADGKLTRGFLRVEGDEITRIPYTKKSDLIAALPKRARHGRRSADSDF